MAQDQRVLSRPNSFVYNYNGLHRAEYLTFASLLDKEKCNLRQKKIALVSTIQIFTTKILSCI